MSPYALVSRFWSVTFLHVMTVDDLPNMQVASLEFSNLIFFGETDPGETTNFFPRYRASYTLFEQLDDEPWGQRAALIGVISKKTACKSKAGSQPE